MELPCPGIGQVFGDRFHVYESSGFGEEKYSRKLGLLRLFVRSRGCALSQSGDTYQGCVGIGEQLESITGGSNGEAAGVIFWSSDVTKLCKGALPVWAKILQTAALRNNIPITFSGDSVAHILYDFCLQIGREFMTDERKDSGAETPSDSAGWPEISTQIVEFLIYLVGLVLGVGVFAALLYATVGTYRLSNSVTIPPDIAFILKWVAYWFLFCGAFCAVAFVTKITFAFFVSLIRKRRPKTSS